MHFTIMPFPSKVNIYLFILTVRTEFLSQFLSHDCWKRFKKFNSTKDSSPYWAKKWDILDKAYVNFSHFIRVKEGASGWSFTKHGIHHAWCRHAAYFMEGQFPCVDLLIPVAYLIDDMIHVSLMVISVKNHWGKSKDNLRKLYLDESMILGKPDTLGTYTRPETRSNLLLALRTLPFIHHVIRKNNINENTPDSDDWIEFKERNPYIAFVMSIGSGDDIQDDQKFVSELQVFQS